MNTTSAPLGMTITFTAVLSAPTLDQPEPAEHWFAVIAYDDGTEHCYWRPLDSFEQRCWNTLEEAIAFVAADALVRERWAPVETIEAESTDLVPVVELTPAQRRIFEQWARFGAASFVERMGRGWWVTVEGSTTPTPFPTQWQALAHAETRLTMLLGGPGALWGSLDAA